MLMRNNWRIFRYRKHERMILLIKRLLFSCAALFSLLLCTAHAETTVSLTARDGAVGYRFSLPGEAYAVLAFQAPNASGQMVIAGENGDFDGEIPLPLSPCGGEVELVVRNLQLQQQGSESVLLPAAADYAAPTGGTNAQITGFSLTETPDGLHYTFEAAGADYLRLEYQSRQETGVMTIYPLNNAGHFEGDIPLTYTYARTLTTVRIRSAKNAVLIEKKARKGYQAPEAPEAPEGGRLCGVTVCIDAGHQENGRPKMEPLGPGLTGKTTGSGGMAQGKVTLRKESIVCLEAAMALRDELIRQGATVVMTREDQTTALSNRERCDIAEAGGADFMLRLHCDTRENQRKRGVSVYAPLHSQYAQAVADKETYREMANLLLNATKRSAGYALGEETGFVTLTDSFVGNNWAKMPCFLVEMGFMSNSEDDLLLSTPTHQQKLAEGMAQGIYELAVYRGLISP